MRKAMLASLLLLLVARPSLAQQSEAELRAAMTAAGPDATPTALIAAGAAATTLRDYRAAGEFFRRAREALRAAEVTLLANRLNLALESGAGVYGSQQVFREERARLLLSPMEVTTLANSFPELLIGGELDDVIGRMSGDSPDPEYRCTCYGSLAWMHQVAGRQTEARAYWDSLVVSWEQNPPQSNLADASADILAQWARNYARAGRRAEAMAKLEESMAIRVSDAARAGIQRRWAQAYAELGDARSAVRYLEPLLQQHTLVTVQSLEARISWAPIRNDPEFRALLDRYR